MTSGQIVSALIASAGVALLVLALMRETHRVARVKAELRCAVVEALMMTAGLALLLVQRLDPTALPRVLARVKAAMWSAIVAERSRR